MKHLILILLLSSCSATNLLRRAIKKDPSIVKTDTIVIEKIIEGEKGATIGIDSVIVDNSRIYIKALANGKINLNYIVKDVVIQDTTDVITIVAPPSRKEVKEKAKTERKKVKEQGKTDRVVARKKHSKDKPINHTSHWVVFLLGMATMLSINLLSVILYKRFFR